MQPKSVFEIWNSVASNVKHSVFSLVRDSSRISSEIPSMGFVWNGDDGAFKQSLWDSVMDSVKEYVKEN